jgi:hypothetical protein
VGSVELGQTQLLAEAVLTCPVFVPLNRQTWHVVPSLVNTASVGPPPHVVPEQNAALPVDAAHASVA